MQDKIDRTLKQQDLPSERVVVLVQLAFVSVLFLVYLLSLKPLSYTHYDYLVLDVLAIAVLIFSYHRRYQRPFSFSFLAPTFLYDFLLITRRCLSYDPLKVATVGMTGYMPKLGHITLPNITVLGIPHSLELVGFGVPTI